MGYLLITCSALYSMICPSCGKKIIRSSDVCPFCKQKTKPPVTKVSIYYILISITVLIIFGIYSSFTPDTFEPGAQTSIKSNGKNAPSQLKQPLDVSSLSALHQKTLTFFKAQQRDSAVLYAHHLLSESPQSELANFILCEHHFSRNEFDQANRFSRTLISQFPNEKNYQIMAARIQKELEEDETHQLQASQHFQLQYSGNQAYSLSSDLLQTLETAYADLRLKFNFYPSNKIKVLLSDNTLSNQSALPDWVEASFDGKIRLSIKTVSNLTKNKSVIVHELTHAYLWELCQNKIPIWLNEGLSQWVDGRHIKFQQNHSTPSLKILNEPFVKLQNPGDAHNTYAVALAMTQKLIELKSMNLVVQFLNSLKDKPVSAIGTRLGILDISEYEIYQLTLRELK